MSDDKKDIDVDYDEKEDLCNNKDIEKTSKISEEVSEDKIEVVRKYVRFEENTFEYLKLIYKRYNRIINVVALVLVVLMVYLLLLQSAKTNSVNTEVEGVEYVETDTNSAEIESDKVSENTYEAKEKSNGKVYITGEVLTPGVYDIKEGDRIENIINYAGGTTVNANVDIINLSEIVEDEQHIVIPNINESEESMNVSGDSGVTGKSNDSTKVNINKASLEELKAISGVGDTIATNIIQYREENGNFKSIEDIKNVTGVGEKSFEKMKNQITV